MDLNDYQSQIKELLLLKGDPDFNSIFNKMFVNETTSDKFLIKMELSRLAKPCQRIIDLRGKVQQKCEPFTYDNTLHYLDQHAKDIFEKNIKIYNQYTIGAFEDVMKEHVKIKKQQQNNKSNVPSTISYNQQCKLISLLETNKRAAPRMFFVSEIEVELESGVRITAQTTNISISGLRIKLKDPIDITGKKVARVTFTGLRREFTHTKSLTNARYKLVGQNLAEDVQYIYLNYIDNNADLITFIQEFIRANQYKYKIDVYYYYQLAKNKLLSHYYLANAHKLVIALNCKSSTPFLFSLENKQNREMIDYWQFEKQNNLYSLFNETRVLQLLESHETPFSITLYSFTYVNNGMRYYLSATEEELLEKEIKSLFIHYGCRKKSWRVFNLSLKQYNHQSKKNAENTGKGNDQLNNITHIATLEDITQRPTLSENLSGKDLNALNQFVHHDHVEGPQNSLQLFPVERRKEPRYIYKSNIMVKFEGREYPAIMLDLSLSGLKVKLKAPITLPNNALVNIDLVDLQKVSQKFSLSDMSYKLMNDNPKSILNLQVADPQTQQLASSFFSLLIQHNPAHFERVMTQDEQVSFSDELKIIQGAAHFSCALFVQKEKHLFNIKYASIDNANTALISLFSLLSDKEKEINITPITNNHLYRRLISHLLNNKKEAALLTESIIYIIATQSRNKRWVIKSYLDEDFSSTKERDDFIEYSKAKSDIYAVHYRLTALDKPNFSLVQREMDAISRFALHLAKKLQDDLKTMSGLIEITNCTAVYNSFSKR